jgi:hypothetical protein
VKKDQATEWFEKILRTAKSIAEARGFGQVVHNHRLVHDEVAEGARWAGRWALETWPFAPDHAGSVHRPGLRFEAWFRPGKASDVPLTLLLACSDEPSLKDLRTHLSPVWEALLTGGKAAGRYQALERIEPLALKFEREVVGVARHVAPDWRKVEPAVEWLLVDSHKLLAAAVARWHADAGSNIFNDSPVDPLEALRKRFSGES